MGKCYKVYSDICPKISDRVGPSTSLCRVQMCFIWNSQHMGGNVSPLWSLTQNDNVVDVFHIFQLVQNFRQMLPQPWAGSLVNMGFHLDRMEKSSQGMWIQLPAVPSSDPKTDTFAQGLMRFWCMLILGLCPTWLRLSPDHTPSLMPTRMSILLSSEDRSFTLVNKLWIETSAHKQKVHYL